MMRMTGIIGMARSAMIGVLAIGAATLMLPATAEAGPGPQKIAHKLDRLAYETKQVPGVHGLRHQDKEIDRIQSRLQRLERISYQQRGRRARRNDTTIDHLQHRLRRMERRIETKIAHRENGRYGRNDGRRDVRGVGRRDGGYDHGRDGRWGRDRNQGNSGPSVVFGGYNWRN